MSVTEEISVIKCKRIRGSLEKGQGIWQGLWRASFREAQEILAFACGIKLFLSLFYPPRCCLVLLLSSSLAQP
eukprot:2639796-Rhodomonas_salina.4